MHIMFSLFSIIADRTSFIWKERAYVPTFVSEKGP